MKILVALTYYTPYVSGLTIYADRIARAWVKEGHEVVVLTSQHTPDLPKEEVIEGVRVIRSPILFRISKGSIMPVFWMKAIHLVKWADVVNLHLPQFDAAWVAWLGKITKTFTILTYHCDLVMPGGFVNRIANKAILWMNDLAGRFSDRIIAYTEDYAKHSFFLPKFAEKISIIQPPVELPEVDPSEIAEFQNKVNSEGKHPIIGMACRFAADKGVEILLEALPEIIRIYPNCCVFFAGPYEDVLGEKAYYLRLKPILQNYIDSGHWKFLGSLSPWEMTKFYQIIDLLTMPSLNRTDAFGLVQIEAMMNGKPVVASNLPGIRIPVQRHGMGEIVPIGDSQKLADAIIHQIGLHQAYQEKTAAIRTFYAPSFIAAEYDRIFKAHGIK
ncbi:MAG: glycosyltransferase family 4 protein [Flexilinea flocculi]|jgi:glycosyltransferase involved in cell wall biosynthesis|nr:glycosyltransferase family 4 protein [Flexilinea flocculi]